MSRLARRLFSRDTSLSSRFQRGIRVGFVTTMAVAVVTVVLTEVSSNSFDRTAATQEQLSEQRVRVAQLGNLIPLLASADTPAAADGFRVEIGSAMVDVRRRHVAIQLGFPEEQLVDVELPGGPLSFDRAFDQAMAEVETTIGRLSDETLLATFRADSVSSSVAHLAAMDAAYVQLAAGVETNGFASTTTLRTTGRVLFAFALLAAFARVIVIGRPLIAELREEKSQLAEVERAQREVQMRSGLTSRLAEGMEAVDTEASVRTVVGRTLKRLLPTRPAEMLLADSSMAHLSLHAQNPLLPKPGCGVQSPWSCPAVRRAGTQIFDDSAGIRACPHLADRPEGQCSAVCVPVSFVGDSMGVLHVTGPLGWKPTEFDIFSLEALAGQTAVRLGAIRSFARAEIQASTDVLTGLPNRRAVEDNLSRFVSSRARGSVAILDLDHFKLLNDNYGHEAGDRALRMFAEVLRSALRDDDIAGRWGGEEFVAVLPELSAREAATVLDRIRDELAEACAKSDGPTFTVSIGVVDTSAAVNVDTLVGLADACLYVAKEEGRDRVVVGPVAVGETHTIAGESEALV